MTSSFRIFRLSLRRQSPYNPLPRFVWLRSLGDFAKGLEEGSLLCPVRALSIYLQRTKGLAGHASSLFVLPRRPSQAISKNALSFFLREVIRDSSAIVTSSAPVRAHSIHGVATSVSFLRNWAVSKVLEATTWKFNSVFASFYLNDVSYVCEGLRSLGPFVAAGQVVAPQQLFLFFARLSVACPFLLCSSAMRSPSGTSLLLVHICKSCSSSATWLPFGTSRGLACIFGLGHSTVQSFLFYFEHFFFF